MYKLPRNCTEENQNGAHIALMLYCATTWVTGAGAGGGDFCFALPSALLRAVPVVKIVHVIQRCLVLIIHMLLGECRRGGMNLLHNKDHLLYTALAWVFHLNTNWP